MPSCAFALFRPASWFWLNPWSVNLPMSLTSATVVAAVGVALLAPAVAERRRTATQIVTTAMAAAQRGILKCSLLYGKSTCCVPALQTGILVAC